MTYVDGISVTRGNPCKHIWSFISSLQENSIHYQGENEYAPNNSFTASSIVRNDYFCESGCFGKWQWNVFYTMDQLWTGKQCGLIEKDCCLAPGLLWFHKTFNTPITDYIEMRVCGDEPSCCEDSPVVYYEL